MSSTSHLVCQLIHQLNTHFGELVATYTFDAGPNACIFLTEKFVGLVAALLRHFFAGSEEPNFFRGEEIEVVEEDVAKLLGSLSLPRVAGGLKYLIHTSPIYLIVMLETSLLALLSIAQKLSTKYW